MFDRLRELIAQDSDYSQRTWNLEIWRRVLCGTIYDCLLFLLYKELGEDGTHIKLRDRRSSARHGLVKVTASHGLAGCLGRRSSDRSRAV